MKAFRVFGIWKAIAFLAIVISLSVSCSSCDEPDIDLNPKISLLAPENVTANSAVLVASLTTKDKPLAVIFHYSKNGRDTVAITDAFPANQTVIVKNEITGLARGKVYQFSAEACLVHAVNGTKGYEPIVSTIGTKGFATLDPSILIIKEMKSDFTSISLKLELTPKVANTKVQLDYTVNGSVITKLSEAYSGNSAVEVNFKLDNLVKNTDYQIKVKTVNEFAVEVDTIFKTCAVSDFDGNTYRIVTIGSQVWLQENFRGTHFANGDAIPNVTDQVQWEAMTTPAYCWYNNDSKIGDVYGGLYNWYVASDPRGLIVGYHTPAQAEWYVLADYLGGKEVAGGKMKEAGYAHWIQPNAGATNSSGFSGLPGGVREDVSFNGKGFINNGDGGVFWTTTKFESVPGLACSSSIGENSTSLNLNGGNDYDFAFSIRLVKN